MSFVTYLDFKQLYCKTKQNTKKIKDNSGQQLLDTFEFEQGHVTKNQLITVLVFLSESLGV